MNWRSVVEGEWPFAAQGKRGQGYILSPPRLKSKISIADRLLPSQYKLVVFVRRKFEIGNAKSERLCVSFRTSSGQVDASKGRTHPDPARIVVTGAIVIWAGFEVAFACGEGFAGLGYAVHEVDSKPAPSKPEGAARSLCPMAKGLPPAKNVCPTGEGFYR